MKKRGLHIVLFLLTFIILLVPASIALFASPSVTGTPPTTVKPGIDSTTAYQQVYDVEDEPLSVKAQRLPDLIVTDIILPAEMPIGGLIETFSVVIQNIGRGVAQGELLVETQVIDGEKGSCRVKVNVGGAGGFADVREGGTTNRNRFTKILPGESRKVPIYVQGTSQKFDLPLSCQTPRTRDFTVRATVNPAGGKGAKSARVADLQGNIFESDSTNNVLEKTVRVVENPISKKTMLKFFQGTNAFSMPVKMSLTAQEFIAKTNCELFKQPANDGLQDSDSYDLSNKELVDLFEQLVPGIGYFAECPYLTFITVEGDDPEPFDKLLNPRRLTLLPTRAGMEGKKLYELVKGCSRPVGSQTKAFTFTPGLQTASKKLRQENKPLVATGVVPGLLYAINCDSSYGGTWDPSKETFLKDSVRMTEYAYRGEDLQPSEPGIWRYRSASVGSGVRYTGYYSQRSALRYRYRS